MKIKTSELTGPLLHWWVAKCLGAKGLRMHTYEGYNPGPPALVVDWEFDWIELDALDYSYDWARGGPIIEWEGIRLHRGVGGYWWAATDEEPQRPVSAPSPLVAAMRCYVASKLGDEVEIPDELKEN